MSAGMESSRLFYAISNELFGQTCQRHRYVILSLLLSSILAGWISWFGQGKWNRLSINEIRCEKCLVFHLASITLGIHKTRSKANLLCRHLASGADLSTLIYPHPPSSRSHPLAKIYEFPSSRQSTEPKEVGNNRTQMKV
jgi:hypothetical protein